MKIWWAAATVLANKIGQCVTTMDLREPYLNFFDSTNVVNSILKVALFVSKRILEIS